VVVLAIGMVLACAGEGGDSGGGTGGTDSEAVEARPVDVLLVFDTSSSMFEESSAVLLAADELVAAMGDEDWRIGVTTTSVDFTAGPTADLDPGESGTLAGPVVEPGSGAVDALRELLACRTIVFKASSLPLDSAYEGTPGDCPTPDGLSRDYLECLCPDGWSERDDSGAEEGLEAVVETLCRGEDPPADCFDASVPITADDAGSVDLWRAGSRRRVWLISDEGDSSRRVATSDSDPAPYLDLFTQLGDPRFSAIGPRYEDNDGTCLAVAQTWGVVRYQEAAEATGGVYVSLTGSADSDCEPRDVGALLAEGLEADH
jgi:hypothetical protein